MLVLCPSDRSSSLTCSRFTVSLARPSAPRNCSLQTGNNSAEGGGWLRVRCVAGYDGGLPQAFLLEALDPITGRTRFNGSVNDTGVYCQRPRKTAS